MLLSAKPHPRLSAPCIHTSHSLSFDTHILCGQMFVWPLIEPDQGTDPAEKEHRKKKLKNHTIFFFFSTGSVPCLGSLHGHAKCTAGRVLGMAWGQKRGKQWRLTPQKDLAILHPDEKPSELGTYVSQEIIIEEITAQTQVWVRHCLTQMLVCTGLIIIAFWELLIFEESCPLSIAINVMGLRGKIKDFIHHLNQRNFQKLHLKKGQLQENRTLIFPFFSPTFDALETISTERMQKENKLARTPVYLSELNSAECLAEEPLKSLGGLHLHFNPECSFSKLKQKTHQFPGDGGIWGKQWKEFGWKLLSHL